MIDRLAARGLVERCPLAQDRRCVVCRIASDGLELLSRLDGEVSLREVEVLQALTLTEVKSLTGLLDRVRGGIGPSAASLCPRWLKCHASACSTRDSSLSAVGTGFSLLTSSAGNAPSPVRTQARIISR